MTIVSMNVVKNTKSAVAMAIVERGSTGTVPLEIEAADASRITNLLDIMRSRDQLLDGYSPYHEAYASWYPRKLANTST